MQLFPRDGHCLARPSSRRLDGPPRHPKRPPPSEYPLGRVRFVRAFKRIEQRISKRRALFSRERKGLLEQIGGFRTHRVILPPGKHEHSSPSFQGWHALYQY